MREGKCSICGKKSTHPIPHAGIAFCPEHFSHYIEKKIKQGTREIGIFGRKGRFGILLAGDVGSSAVFEIMKEIAEGRGDEIVEINGRDLSPMEIAELAKKNSAKSVITGHSIEDFIIQMLIFCSNKKTSRLLKLSPKTGIWGKVSGISFPSPAFRLYRTELEEYAKLKGLKFSSHQKSSELEQALSLFIERLETKHPGTKHKMLKSLLYFSRFPAKANRLEE